MAINFTLAESGKSPEPKTTEPGTNLQAYLTSNGINALSITYNGLPLASNEWSTKYINERDAIFLTRDTKMGR